MAYKILEKGMREVRKSGNINKHLFNGLREVRETLLPNGIQVC
jgi:hypothetical protein